METTQRTPEQEICPVLAELYQTHYRSLFRLAALLTTDTDTAEAVVLESFVALRHVEKRMRTCDDAVPHLRQLLVARSRTARLRHRRADGGQPPAMAGTPARADPQQEKPPFESSAVMLALRTLRTGQREAVVLTLYLDLTDEQAAAAMRVSQATLRRYLAGAKTMLRATLAATP